MIPEETEDWEDLLGWFNENVTDEVLTCGLENPEVCDSCQ
jgi:hypothetical protein